MNLDDSFYRMAANFLRDGLSLFDAGADGRATQIIAGEPEILARKTVFRRTRYAIKMPEIVLRESAFIELDICKDRLLADGEDRN